MDIVNFLQIPTVIVTIVTLACTILCKTAIKIFRLGATYKTQFVTKEEQRHFEEAIRKDMRAYRDEIQKSVTEICLARIDAELKEYREMKQNIEEIKKIKIQMDVQYKELKAGYDDVKSIKDEIRVLQNKVTRLEFGDKSQQARRTEQD